MPSARPFGSGIQWRRGSRPSPRKCGYPALNSKRAAEKSGQRHQFRRLPLLDPHDRVLPEEPPERLGVLAVDAEREAVRFGDPVAARVAALAEEVRVPGPELKKGRGKIRPASPIQAPSPSRP